MKSALILINYFHKIKEMHINLSVNKEKENLLIVAVFLASDKLSSILKFSELSLKG